jgi:hypothetical protein
MQVWNSLDLRKQNTRLRVTAMAACRARAVWPVSCWNWVTAVLVPRVRQRREDDAAALAQRLPGADLAVLSARGAPRLLALHRGAPAQGEPAALTTAGYAFTAIKR